MQNRPIEILVNALKDLGANIHYEAKEGYPPIRITGKKITKKRFRYMEMLAVNIFPPYY